MKKVLLLSFVCFLFCSCGKSKFDETLSLLSSLPVFFEDHRVEQNIDYEDGKIIISFPYKSQTPEWASRVIGDSWVPEVFMQKLLNNNIAAYTIGSVLESEKGGSPIDEFLSLVDEKKASFVIRYGNNEVTYTTKDVRDILDDDSGKNIAAPLFAKQLANFAKDYNDVLQEKGLYMVNAVKESSVTGNDIVYININCKKNLVPKAINTIAMESLEQYLAIPIYCHLNNLGLAFRYHTVNNDSELTTNVTFDKANVEYNSLKDAVFFVPEERMAQIWQLQQERVKSETEQNKE